MKRSIAPYYYESVCLRLITESDLETTLTWRNREDARVWFKTSNLLTLEQHEAWFHRYQHKDDDFLFIVEVGGASVGQASVYDIHWETGRAEIGRFLISPENGGKGYITLACAALIRLCADSLNLQSLFLEVMENNERAIRLYQRNGFLEERRYDGLIRMSRELSLMEKA